jgi:Domain of unknown function (DUF4279)
MSEYEFTISLRIRHPDIDPSSITAHLGVEPQHTWRAGDARRDATGDELSGVYRESYWMGRLMEEPQLSSAPLSVEGMILQLIARLRRAQSWLEQLNSEGGVSELHVSLFARADFELKLSPELVAALDRSRLGVIFEVHPHPLASYDLSVEA